MTLGVITVDGKFAQKIGYQTSLSVSELISSLSEFGVHAVEIDLIDSVNIGIPSEVGTVLFGGFPGMDSINFLTDHALNLYLLGLKILPSLDAIFSYENKSYQSICAKRLGVSYVQQYSFLHYSQPESSGLEFPLVYKSPFGAGSSNVLIVNNKSELKKAWIKQVLKKSNLVEVKDYIKFGLSKLLFSSDSVRSRWSVKRPKSCYVLQEFVEGLEFDYKVLVFYDKIFVLRRNVRHNSFKASGSGNFEFLDVDADFLDFCFFQARLLAVPYVSMDVIKTSSGYSIIEFQCLHFGAYTQINSPYHYVRDVSGSWSQSEEHLSLERVYAYAISKYYI